MRMKGCPAVGVLTWLVLALFLRSTHGQLNCLQCQGGGSGVKTGGDCPNGDCDYGEDGQGGFCDLGNLFSVTCAAGEQCFCETKFRNDGTTQVLNKGCANATTCAGVFGEFGPCNDTLEGLPPAELDCGYCCDNDDNCNSQIYPPGTMTTTTLAPSTNLQLVTACQGAVLTEGLWTSPGDELEIQFMVTDPASLCDAGMGEVFGDNCRIFGAIDVEKGFSQCHPPTPGSPKIPQVQCRPTPLSTYGWACSVELTSAANQIYSIHLAATLDNKNDGDLTLEVRLLEKKIVDGVRTDLRIADSCEIRVENRHSCICYSHNDPHMSHFDCITYELQNPGMAIPGGLGVTEWVMYKNDKFKAEVQIGVAPCSGFPDATGIDPSLILCNCKVAVRAVDFVFVVDSCQVPPVPMEQYFSPDATDPPGGASINTHGLQIYVSDDATRYEVIFIQGTRVQITVQSDIYMNIMIIPSAADYGLTEGLCGNANGDPEDEFDTTDPGPGGPGSVMFFTMMHRVNNPQSIFEGVGDMSDLAPFPVYCVCPVNKTDGVCEMPIECDSSFIHEDCDYSIGDLMEKDASFIDSVAKLPPSAPPPGKKRRKRQTTSGFRPGLTWDSPDRTFNETEAIALCDGLFDNPMVLACLNMTDIVLTDWSRLVCVADIMYLDALSFFEGALDGFRDYCKTELLAIVDETATDDDLATVLAILNSICPFNCNGRGTCSLGSCVCDAGFLGFSCRTPVDAKPSALLLALGCNCDIRSPDPDCNRVVIFARDITTLTPVCQFTEYELDRRGATATGRQFTRNGMIIASNAVSCPIDDGPQRNRAFYIRLSNDGGATFSTGRVFYITEDSNCQDCTDDCIQDSKRCDLLPDTCFENGQCFLKYERIDSTRVCHPPTPTPAPTTTTPAPTPAPTTTTRRPQPTRTPRPPPRRFDDNDDDLSRRTIIIIIVVSILGVLFIIVIIIVFFCWCRPTFPSPWGTPRIPPWITPRPRPPPPPPVGPPFFARAPRAFGGWGRNVRRHAIPWFG